jgi:hypothetical protein
MIATTAKDLRVAPISRQDADRVVKAIHYSGKVVTNSQLHLGVFLGTRLEGAMQFGPSLDRRKLLPLVSGTAWNAFLELNRMAFSDNLPRNSESRAIGVAMRLLRKQYPQIEWVVSFADATQCGDGTIYRASGFVLTGLRPNKTIWGAPDGELITDVGVRTSMKKIQTFSKVGLTSSATRERARAAGIIAAGGNDTEYKGGAGMKHYQAAGFKPLEGFQLRYVYFVNPAARVRLTVPVIPFSEIRKAGAAMYRGVRDPRFSVGSIPAETAVFPTEEGGSTPTPTLHEAKP